MSVSKIRDNSHAIAALLEKAARRGNIRTAQAIAHDAGEPAPVLTGSLKASPYWSAVDATDYEDARAEAVAHNPKVTVNERIVPESADEVVVGFVAGHDLFIEMGTAHMAPRPLLHPAADRNRAKHPQFVAEEIAGALK